MANKSLFSSFRRTNVPKANTVNNAGGLAYTLSAEAALAQYSVTTNLAVIESFLPASFDLAEKDKGKAFITVRGN